MDTIDIPGTLEAIAAATERLLTTARHLDDAAVAEPSLLPGWDRAMVLTHVARNADGITRMLAGAQRGEVAAMYPGGAQGRAADIAAGQGRPAAQAAADVASASERLAAACAATTPDGWLAAGQTLARRVALWEMLPSRLRELEVHHSDLGAGYDPAQWPSEFVAAELDREAAGLGPRLPAGMAVRLVAAEGQWQAGPDGAELVVVSAPASQLLAWLWGRPHSLVDPPPIGPWQ